MSKFNDEVIALLFKVGADKIKSSAAMERKLKKREMRICSGCKNGFVCLISSRRKSCSTKCKNSPNPRYKKGDTFPGSRLTVVKYMGKRNRTDAYECKCTCGKKTLVEGRYLASLRTKSCGCYLEEYRQTKVGRKENRKGVAFKTGKTGYFNTWQRVNSLNWYMKDAVETPLLVPPEATTLKKYKDNQ